MKITVNHNTIQFVIDVKEWTISGTTGEYVNGKAVYYENPVAINLPKRMVRTLNDLTF